MAGPWKNGTRIFRGVNSNLPRIRQAIFLTRLSGIIQRSERCQKNLSGSVESENVSLARPCGGGFFAFRRQQSSLRSNGEDVCDNRFALGRFQTRAVRHTGHDLRPVFGAIMPERWQRVAFDAATDQKRAALAQHRTIDMLSLPRGRHLQSHRWDVVRQFATGQHASEHDKDRRLLHLRDQSRRSCAPGNQLRPACPLPAQEQ